MRLWRTPTYGTFDERMMTAPVGLFDDLPGGRGVRRAGVVER